VISVRLSARGNGFPEGLKLIIERCSYYKGSVLHWEPRWNEPMRGWALLLADRSANLHVYTSVMGFVIRHWTLLISETAERNRFDSRCSKLHKAFPRLRSLLNAHSLPVNVG